jgi:hypothetical protein
LAYFHPTKFEKAIDSFDVAINMFCKLEDNVKACGVVHPQIICEFRWGGRQQLQ